MKLICNDVFGNYILKMSTTSLRSQWVEGVYFIHFSMSDYELDEMATAEADGELQIATECWVEPQYGLVVNSSPERKQLDSLDFKQLSQAVSHIFFHTLFQNSQVLS